MPKTNLTTSQLRTAIVKCHTQLAHMLQSVQRSDPEGETIGQSNRVPFHDIVVHALGLLRHPLTPGGSYRNMITQAYAGSVHQKEGAPRREAVRAIMAVLETVAATLKDEAPG